VETKAGDLQDWFFLKHGLEHYAVPKTVRETSKPSDAAYSSSTGLPVAQIMAVADKEILLYMFPSNELGHQNSKGKNGRLSKTKDGLEVSPGSTTPASWSHSRETRTR